MGNTKTVVLSLDDFSVVNNRMDLLLKLKEYFPDFKVSLFTVPLDEVDDWGISLIRNDILKEIRKNLGWMQIIPHGLTHNGREMAGVSYDSFKQVLELIKSNFELDQLPYIKGFKAPHYSWNEDVINVLDDEGWFGAINPFKYMLSTKSIYRHNQTIDNIDYSQDLLKLSGHVYGCKDDLGKNMDNLLKLPKDTQFKFITDYIEEL